MIFGEALVEYTDMEGDYVENLMFVIWNKCFLSSSVYGLIDVPMYIQRLFIQ